MDAGSLWSLRGGLATPGSGPTTVRTQGAGDQGRRCGRSRRRRRPRGLRCRRDRYVAIAPRPIDVNDPWYILASQLALWVGFVGAVVVASRRNGTGNLCADYGLSWPRLKDLWLGLVGSVLGRILPLLVLICIVVAGSGFGTPNALRRGSWESYLPEGRRGWF